ncbi:M23 family metallopeptidase [Aurantimonas marianensis]|uniref:M23 family metallopeptidase n=1 Tax=Aurantimonas marianensis TaxID=2920428 RepID=A0A9X2HBB5_9HYPH|nr:M23 family metallopeptidase [Aurantimonas marianensis]MCP3054484.1 M23 family metallopeptidase [Aurantimonas marianensis]
MAASKHRRTFGEHREPHTIIIARGGQVRHFTVGRRSLLLGTAFASLVVLASVAAPTWLIMQDDIAARLTARQAQIRQDYEQRIASLRSQLDTVTSRQMISQKMVETKVDVLLDQQEELSARYDKLRPLYERAQEVGVASAPIPLPTPNPRLAIAALPIGTLDSLVDEGVSEPVLPPPAVIVDPIRTGSVGERAAFTAGLRPSSAAPVEPTRKTQLADAMIREVGRSIDIVELRQIEHLQSMAETARTRTLKIAAALKAAGIDVPELDEHDTATGGPFEPVPVDYDFDESYAELDTALASLQKVHSVAATLPISEPLPGSRLSSSFGIRSDPFLGRRGLHSGDDYAAATGTPVPATAPGTVTKAGRAGGYGNLVEIDHGNGITTRYAHMSRVDVAVGQTVAKGTKIGEVGSTGRSTGPHLHYEVRRAGRAVDPARFRRIGLRIEALS